MSSDHTHSPYEPQPKPNPAPSNFFSSFLSKSLLVGILLVLLPFFPSQAPEFVNQTISTRSWELVVLLFVGIAVSYGLFSRRHEENEKENHSKFDTTQSFMSRVLQVSSVFDDEMENQSCSDENKIQTWNSRHYRGNSTVLVAETDSLLDEHNRTISRSAFSDTKSSHKPLQLPVRSLRSQVPDKDETASASKSGGSCALSRSGTLSRSGSGVKNPSNTSLGRTRSGEKTGVLDASVLEEKLKETLVLPSPIPWRSRSGRFEFKDDVGGGGGSGGGGGNPPSRALPPAVGEFEVDRVNSFVRRSTIPWSSRPSSTSPSPRKLSPAPSVSSEVQAKNSDDSGKRRSYYKSSPPPPPPPPPPVLRKSPLTVSSSTPIVHHVSFNEKGYNSSTSLKNELKDFSRNKRGDLPPSRMNVTSSTRDSAKPDAKSSFDGSSSVPGKSVRTASADEQIDEYAQASDAESVYGGSSKAFERVLADSDEEGSDYETNASQGNSDAEESVMKDQRSEASSPPDPNEVDKKAEEFIAKFREQIRLQRIDSIKRSSGKSVARNSTR